LVSEDGVEKRSADARVAAIVLGVILLVTRVATTIALTIIELRKQKQEKNADGVFKATPPGGHLLSTGLLSGERYPQF
jgi:hypothetical protein